MAGMVSRIVGAAIIAAGATGLMGAAAPEAGIPHLPNGLPDFSSGNMGFASDGVEFFPVPGEKFVPVTNDPAHPFCGNRRSLPHSLQQRQDRPQRHCELVIRDVDSA